jgi:hypothetical protein
LGDEASHDERVHSAVFVLRIEADLMSLLKQGSRLFSKSQSHGMEFAHFILLGVAVARPSETLPRLWEDLGA